MMWDKGTVFCPTSKPEPGTREGHMRKHHDKHRPAVAATDSRRYGRFTYAIPILLRLFRVYFSFDRRLPHGYHAVINRPSSHVLPYFSSSLCNIAP